MSEEAPKLYTNKPKKAQLKQSTTAAASSPAASSYRMGSQSTAPPPPPPPPPTPPPRKESFARPFKFFVPLILTVNLAVVGYMFMRTKKNEDSLEEEKEKANDVSPTQVSSTTAAVTEKPISSTPTILEPLKPREPIPESQQRELYKWMLEEKRKIKPKDPEEKKRIDEEKAILKKFIRSKSLPSV